MPPNKLVARRAGDPTARPNRFDGPNPVCVGGASSASNSSGIVASFRMLRRAWRRRHAVSLWSSVAFDPGPLAAAASGGGASPSEPLAVAPTPAARIGADEVPTVTAARRMEIDEDDRALGRTSTI
ncbi:MAG: hypothetical protein DMG01_08975 [Acidobacteria bacterium]|nr:MAG: hypothetical protein DMG01_08975 [Acidobacteriota bacterium]